LENFGTQNFTSSRNAKSKILQRIIAVRRCGSEGVFLILFFSKKKYARLARHVMILLQNNFISKTLVNINTNQTQKVFFIQMNFSI